MKRGVFAWFAAASVVLRLSIAQNTHAVKLFRGASTYAGTTWNPMTTLPPQSPKTNGQRKPSVPAFAKGASHRWTSTKGVPKTVVDPPSVTSDKLTPAVTDDNLRRKMFNFMAQNKCSALPRSSYSLRIHIENRINDETKRFENTNINVIFCNMSHLEGKSNETVEICNSTTVIISSHLKDFYKSCKLYVLFPDVLADARSNTICEPRKEFTIPDAKQPHTSVFHILTLATLLPSVLSLISVLITYAIFAQLRTLPGKNLISLCISLLLIQIIDLSAFEINPAQNLCKSFGIFRHYVIFVSFSNMAVIAFHTLKVFSNDTHVQSRLGNRPMKLFLIYCIFSWGMPAIYMAFFVMLGELDITRLNYSYDRICWISNKSDHLFFFVVPLASFMVWNIFMLCSTVYHIEKKRKQIVRMSSDSRRSKNESSFLIYLKLASLMGFDWLIGLLVYVFPSCSPLVYAFIFFNSLEGVYIAFAFVFTKKTWKLYREKLTDTNSNKTSLSKDRRMTRETHL